MDIKKKTTHQKNTRKKKKKKKPEQKHYRCKAEVFFPPAVFFYAVAKGCIFQFLSNFNSDAKLGPPPQCPPNTKQIQVTLFTFLSRVFKDGTTFSFFLSELYYCSSLYYILRIKLWYCFNLFVRFSFLQRPPTVFWWWPPKSFFYSEK